jgi:class 3 adenylate cyclase
MNRLPSGVVTFLFTDLEDSTRLWERHGIAMRDALLRHDAIMQAAIDEHGGVLVKHTGDGVHAAFADAGCAANACIAAQRRLQDVTSGDVVLRSRMAIYTGEAELQGSDYRGTVLNRAARLMAAGHGGQMLVSQSAGACIAGTLPQGVYLRDLGVRRLKDVPQAEQVFQLVVDGLRSEFPPLRTLDARRLDVPAPTTQFIGRERDLDAIGKALRGGTRLITLTGPGGTGKSRLSIEVARRLVDDYTDGAIFVPLASVGKTEMVMPTIAQALGVQEEAGRDLAQTVGGAVRSKNMLLVLDNFEQIVDAAPVVNMLLEAA